MFPERNTSIGGSTKTRGKSRRKEKGREDRIESLTVRRIKAVSVKPGLSNRFVPTRCPPRAHAFPLDPPSLMCSKFSIIHEQRLYIKLSLAFPGYTHRELLSEVFLEAPPVSSSTSALFVGWGLLLGYDMFLNAENASEPLDIECNAGAAIADVWCPLGTLSDPIPFNRSQAEIDSDADGSRSPLNLATAYVDLDWLYGRDEGSAAALRESQGGYLNITDDELPHLLPDGTWLVSCDADLAPTQGRGSGGGGMTGGYITANRIDGWKIVRKYS